MLVRSVVPPENNLLSAKDDSRITAFCTASDNFKSDNARSSLRISGEAKPSISWSRICPFSTESTVVDAKSHASAHSRSLPTNDVTDSPGC